MPFLKNFLKKIKIIKYLYSNLMKYKKYKFSFFSEGYFSGILFGNYKIYYKSDGMLTYAKNSYEYDLEFMKNLKKAIQACHLENPDYIFKRRASRSSILYYFAHYANSLNDKDSVFVELGTLNGFHGYFLGSIFPQRSFFLFDSFEGMKPEDKTNDERFYRFPDNYSLVKSTLVNFSNINIVKGYLPESLKEFTANIAFLHIDLNNSKPEKESLEKLYPKIISGGVIISDDYSHPGYEKQKKIFDDFAYERGLKVLSFPQGTGVIINYKN
jgi:hypothetical protein